MILVYNGDNQGNDIAKHIIIDEFFDLIVRTATDTELPEDKDAENSLSDYAKMLKLYALKNEAEREYEKKIDGKIYTLNENPMGITCLGFKFTEGTCEMNYTNAQGDKTLYFRIGENEFGIFPEDGYSDQVGSQSEPNHYYRCAVSGAWIEERKLFIRVQIIDDYLGILNMTFGFKDENTLGIYMCKTAEDFLATYQGFATGKALN